MKRAFLTMVACYVIFRGIIAPFSGGPYSLWEVWGNFRYNPASAIQREVEVNIAALVIYAFSYLMALLWKEWKTQNQEGGRHLRGKEFTISVLVIFTLLSFCFAIWVYMNVYVT